MTSSSEHNTEYKEAYVWIWLPNATEPVVAGKLEADGDKLRFNYGRSYLDRINDANSPAISIYEEELPLKEGDLPLCIFCLIPITHSE